MIEKDWIEKYCGHLLVGIIACFSLLFVWMAWNTVTEFHSATVESVRITMSQRRSSQNDGAVRGAIVGGLITDSALGAIAGAAMGSNPRVSVTSHVATCRVNVTLNDGTRLSFSFSDGRKYSCSTFRMGDRVRVLSRKWKGVGDAIYTLSFR